MNKMGSVTTQLLEILSAIKNSHVSRGLDEYKGYAFPVGKKHSPYIFNGGKTNNTKNAKACIRRCYQLIQRMKLVYIFSCLAGSGMFPLP